jgi:hypothetical protein
VDLIRDGKDLYLVKHTIAGNEVPNMGVFLIRNSQWSRQLLRQMWDQDRYIHHKWWENGALLELLGYHHLIDPQREPALNPRLLTRIEWIDPAWNCVPDVADSVERLIVHYAGHSNLQRLLGLGFEVRRALALAEGTLTPPEIHFTLASPFLDSSLPAGEWHTAEPMRWTAELSASLPVRLFREQDAVEIEISTCDPRRTAIDIALDERQLGTAIFDAPGVKRLRFDLGRFTPGQHRLVFTVPELWRPRELLASEDTRLLGIGVGEIRLYSERPLD